MKYQHKENGKVITILDFNEKTKVYLIRFDESGKETNITSSTLKRWYLPIEDPETQKSEKPSRKTSSRKEKSKVKKETAVEPPQVEEKPAESEEQAGDGTPLSQVGKEIAEQAKEKAKKVKKSEKPEKKKVNSEKKEKAEVPDVNNSIQTILQLIEDAGMRAKIYDNDIRTITVKNQEGNCLGEIHVGKQKFVMAFRTKFVPEGFQADRIRNCMNSHAFDIPYSEMDKFTKMMNAIKEVK